MKEVDDIKSIVEKLKMISTWTKRKEHWMTQDTARYTFTIIYKAYILWKKLICDSSIHHQW